MKTGKDADILTGTIYIMLWFNKPSITIAT